MTEAAEAEPSPRDTAEDVDQRAEILDEWGRQSFPASDPPQNW